MIHTNDYYAGQQGRQYQKNVHGTSKFVFALIENARPQKFQPFVNPTDKVLEYGLGNGWNISRLAALEKHGYDVYIDKDVENLGIQLYSQQHQIPTHYFNKIICHHVLEHLSNPFDTLLQLKQYLQKNGELILYVPFEVGKKYRTYHARDKNMHRYSWTVQSFCMMVEQAGYLMTQYKIYKKGYDRYAGNLIERFQLPAKLYSPIKKLLQTIKPEYEIFVRCSLPTL